MIWTSAEVREALEKKTNELGLRMPQMQTLLSQERFLARLCQLKESRYYIWKGGSLLLRLYQHLEVPRFTVDIDFLVREMKIVQVQNVFLEAMKIDLKDGFHFKSLSKSKMERETPYGGDRFEVTWSLFNRGQSESLKIDVCTGDDVDIKFITSKDLFLLPELKEISLSVYPAEFIFAEKLETADSFYTGNTRLKDFIDLWGLIKHPMNQEKLRVAIERCFIRRKRPFFIGRYQQLFTDRNFKSQVQLFYDLGVVFRRLGFILDIYQLAGESLLKKLKNKISKKYLLLDPCHYK